jgi:hypothetical protein
MNAVESLRIPAKRNLAALRAAIEEASASEGTLLRAVFRTARYGVVSVAGQGQRSAVMNALGIANHFIDPGAKPAAELAAVGPDEAEDSGEETPIAELAHGDVVTAAYEHPVYGDFAITAVALAAADSEDLWVGGWLLRAAGALPPLLRTVHRHGAAADLGIDAPSRLQALDVAI